MPSERPGRPNRTRVFLLRKAESLKWHISLSPRTLVEMGRLKDCARVDYNGPSLVFNSLGGRGVRLVAGEFSLAQD